MKRNALIGILLDCEQGSTEGSYSFSQYPYYALRRHYFEAVTRAGGVPVGIGYETSPEDMLPHMAGLLVPGGDFESPEAWYEHSNETQFNAPSSRTHAQIEYVRCFLEADKPFLGICAGMQDICGIFGGKLYKNIQTAFDTNIDYRNGAENTAYAFDADIVEGTRLHGIHGVTKLPVNSHHREAVSRVPEGFVVNAYSPDKAIYGVEWPAKKFCIGVQWHPEFFAQEGNPHMKLFNAFVEACRA